MYIPTEDLKEIVYAIGWLLMGKPLPESVSKKVQQLLTDYKVLISEDEEDDKHLDEELEKRKQDIAYAVEDCHHFIRWKIQVDSCWMDEDEEDEDEYQRIYQRNKRKGWQIKKQN